MGDEGDEAGGIGWSLDARGLMRTEEQHDQFCVTQKSLCLRGWIVKQHRFERVMASRGKKRLCA